MSSLVLVDPDGSADSYVVLYDALGYRFRDVSLLDLALTHRSWCAENGAAPSNERLEFLGDAVLGLSMTDSLYHAEPDQAEGELAKARAEVVSAPVLAAIARTLDVGSLLLVGKGEELSGGRDKDSILCDAMEAIFGAIYLDGGWSVAHEVVVRQLASAAAMAQTTPGERDYKTRLQERAAELNMAAPHYRVAISGPDHGRVFTATVGVEEIVGAGVGTSKKQAQQRAAEQALAALDAGHAQFSSETASVETAAATARSGGMR